jgi:hypothetical protein
MNDITRLNEKHYVGSMGDKYYESNDMVCWAPIPKVIYAELIAKAEVNNHHYRVKLKLKLKHELDFSEYNYHMGNTHESTRNNLLLLKQELLDTIDEINQNLT